MFLKNLEAKRADIFALESETGGPGADLAKLEEDGMEPSRQLTEVFSQKSQRRSQPIGEEMGCEKPRTLTH